MEIKGHGLRCFIFFHENIFCIKKAQRENENLSQSFLSLTGYKQVLV